MVHERGNLSRRGFYRQCFHTLVASGLPAWWARELAAQDACSIKPNANSKIQLGVVGVGPNPRRSNSLIAAARRQPHVAFTRVCDVDARHLAWSIKQFQQDGTTVQGSEDFRELTRSPDVDAVIVAVPDHWHALIALDALRHGKDVYCEKPLTLTVEEAILLRQAVTETGRVLQTGSQQRCEFAGRFRLAADLIRSGRLGTIKSIECRISPNETSGPIPQAAVPDGLNWDWWLGPAPHAPYRSSADGKKTNCHYEYRWWYEYSGGKMTDWGAHHLDFAQWALGMDGRGPQCVEFVSASEPYNQGDGYNCPRDFHVKLIYPGGTVVHAMSGGGSTVTGMVAADGTPAKFRNQPEGVIGPDQRDILIFGEAGTMFVGRDVLLASDSKLLNEPMGEDPELYPERPRDLMKNFLDCVATRQPPLCDVHVGASSAIVCHLGVIALRLRGTFDWDAAACRFTGANAAAANAMLHRTPRNPWKYQS